MTNPQGNPISLGKAAKKYGICKMTLSDWAKDGKITVLHYPERKGQPLLVDEGSVIIAREAYTPVWKRGASRQFPLPVESSPQPPSPPHPSTPFPEINSAPTAAAASALNTADLVKAYLDHGRSVGFASTTLEHLQHVLSRFARACPDLPSTGEPITAFIASLSTSQTTKQVFFAKIKMFYGWLQEYRDITMPHFRKSDIPRAMKKDPKVLTAEERNALLAAIDNKQDRLMVHLILATGLRTTAVCNLTGKDVYPDHVTIRAVSGVKTAYKAPIPPWLYTKLKAQGEGLVFKNSKGKKLTRQALYDRIERSMIKAGIDGEKRGAHVLRHTAAVEHLEATGDLDFVRQLLGHSKVQTTQIYARLRPSKVQEKYQALSPMRNAPGEPAEQGSLNLDTD